MKKSRLLTILVLLSVTIVTSMAQSSIILTSDQQVIDLMDPDKVLDLSTGYNKVYASLRQKCELAQANGQDMLRVKYDAF